MPRKLRTIGREEASILRFVASQHPVPASEIVRHQMEVSGRARTTVMTMLERLRKKGFIARRKVAGVYQYSPRTTGVELHQTVIRDFVSRSLGGSVMPFLAYLSEETELSDEEFLELKRLVDELDTRRKGDSP